MVRPKKYLGQHFLTDETIAIRIVSLLPDNPEKPVLEIGPGTGVLTKYILERNICNFKAIDVDAESIQYLQNKYPDKKENFIFADILKSEDIFSANNNIQIIGNFPYNISSQIFFKILEYKNSVSGVVCMVQKEVADRIASPPGSKTYGILSPLLQAYFDIKIHFRVKAGSFFPPPNVSSSVIALQRNGTTNLNCDEDLFFQIVKTTFNQRRKTIRNSLRKLLNETEKDFKYCSERPEQLGVKEFIELTNWVESKLKNK